MTTSSRARCVVVETRDFERSHARKPNRNAVGTWAFRFDRAHDDWFVDNVAFSDAVKAARAEAVNRNAVVVRVQP